MPPAAAAGSLRDLKKWRLVDGGPLRRDLKKCLPDLRARMKWLPSPERSERKKCMLVPDGCPLSDLKKCIEPPCPGGDLKDLRKARLAGALISLAL